MVSKSSAVRSIRLQNEVWAWLSEEADRRKVSVNALVAEIVNRERLPAYEDRVMARVEAGGFKPPPTPLIEKVARVSVSVPFAGDVQRRPMQKKGK